MMTFFLFISALLAIAAVTVHAVRQDRNNLKQLRSFPPFLQTFAAYSGLASSKAVHKGTNDLIPQLVEHELQQALVNTDTITIQAPAGMYAFVPQLVGVWSAAAPRVPQTNIGITNHDTSTGVTTLTATGAVADNSTITLAYYPSTLGS